MKKIFLVALVAVTLFSCSKENSEAPEGGETKNVTLIIKSAKSVDSRAAEEAGTAHKTPINDLTVYFLNSSGGVVTTASVPTEVINSGPLKFQGISGLAHQVFIVANTTLTDTKITGSTLSALNESILDITNYQEGIDHVLMASVDTSPITAKGTEEGEYQASVEIAPVVARLEIAKLTAVPVKEGSTSPNIASFTVANIYVNGYSETMKLGGEVSQPIQGTKNNFADTPLKDEEIDITATDKVVVPTTPSTVWAYQLFPGNAHTMVIQFSSITFENGTTVTSPAEDLCVTVTAFSPDIFAAANIYHVDNINFSADNIGRPYEANKNITVTLSVVPWAITVTDVVLQ